MGTVPTGGLDRATPVRFANAPTGSVIHPLLMLVAVGDLLGHSLCRSAAGQDRQSLFQLSDHLERGRVLELVGWG
ncbi:MAG TPA: hypothetical protein VI136_14440 [Verrucomicrobiae bacterium]